MKVIREEQKIQNSEETNKKQAKPANEIMLNKELLPSRGKFYKKDIFIKKLSVKQIKDLSSLTKENVNGVLNSILSECISGITLNEILSLDKLWLIYNLRSFTYNDLPMKLKCVCGKCENQSNHDFKLANLMIDYYDETVPDEVTLSNGDKLKFGYTTIGTELMINRLKNDPNVIEAIDEDIMLISSNIKEINGNGVTLYEGYNYVNEKLSPIDFAELVKNLTKRSFGAKPVAKFICPSCGEEILEKINLSQEFFLPKF